MKPGLVAARHPDFGVAAPVSVARCACGALRSDHLLDQTLAGYCILRKNERTARLPGVQPVAAVLR